MPRDPRPLLLAALLAAGPLAGCAAVQDAVLTPALTPMGYPSEILPQTTAVAGVAPAGRGHAVQVATTETLYAPAVEMRPGSLGATTSSLWRTGSRAFFQDQRAHRVGDILTVNIKIDDKAAVNNTSATERKATGNLGLSNFFGLESSLGKILPSAFDPTKAVGVQSDLASNGVGSVNRSEAVNLTVAALVTAVLPNGNLVIQGRQEVRVNAELRELTVAGVVRPEDISSANTIAHTQIAEARVSYGGRGQISNVQKTPYGTALVQKFSPF